jgi:protein-S-isoprenylcysteine O-methyltransferase Ste14
MALREEFESNGTWLFRWRSFLPLLLLALFLLALRDYHYPRHSERLHHIWQGVCLLIGFFGLAIRAYAAGHAPRGTSGRNTRRQIADTLNTTGPYSIVRNPLYLGNFFMGLGPALFPGMWWLTLIYALVFWLYYERIIFAEEAFLREKFGQSFLDWAARTPAFLPRWRHYVPSDLPFSWRTVLRREYNGLLGLVAVLFVLNAAGDAFYLGRMQLDVASIWLLAVIVFVWAVLRTLRKYTHVLDVEGR